MIEFLDITIRNFMSYGNVPTTLILNNAGTTLVQGEDMDNTEQGAGANGTGKSVWLNAIAYGLYDKPISSISKDDLVNNVNKKNMEVTINFKKCGSVYTVKRYRKTKGHGSESNFSVLLKDGVDITPAGAANINNEIENILGIPYDLFVRVIAFTTKQASFLSLPVRSSSGPNQSDMIEELFQLKQLSTKADILKEKIKENEQRLKILVTEFDLVQGENERHQTQLLSTKNKVDKWYDDLEVAIVQTKQKISNLSKIDVDHQKTLHLELQSLTTSCNDAKRTRKELSSKKDQLEQKIQAIQHELTHLLDATCPYCLQEYVDSKHKIQTCETSIHDLNRDMKHTTEQLLDINNTIQTVSDKISEVQSKITISDYEELLDIKHTIQSLKAKLTEFAEIENPHEETLKELMSVVVKPCDSAAIDELKDLIEHQKFLLKLLTKKDSFVRKTLLNKNIPFLNKQLSKYLTELGLQHTVEFTHEMTAKITQFGRELSFGNLSSGQEARVNIALALAFRDVLQSMHEPINVCMFDEVLDVGLDTVGVQLAAKLLKRKARDEKLSLFIVSHRDEINSTFERKMTVQFSKGFSYLKLDDNF